MVPIEAENQVNVAARDANALVLFGLPHATDLARAWAAHPELDAPTWGGSLSGPPLWLQDQLGPPSPPPAARGASARGRASAGRGLPPRPSLLARPAPSRSLPPPPALPHPPPLPPARAEEPAPLTVTPYLSAMPCSVSPARTRCSTWRSMMPAPSGARTLAVLPYERVLVRARLSDSSASSGSEPERERGGGEGAKGRDARGPPSRRASAGEESAMGPAEASGSGSGPRGRRLRRRLRFLLARAAEGRAAGVAGWRQRMEAAVLAWRVPPPPRPAFPGRTFQKSVTSSRSHRPDCAPHPACRDRGGPAVRGSRGPRPSPRPWGLRAPHP